MSPSEMVCIRAHRLNPCFYTTMDQFEEIQSQNKKAVSRLIIAGFILAVFASMSFIYLLLNFRENLINSDVYYKNITGADSFIREKKYDDSLQSAKEALLNAETEKEKAEAHYFMGLSYYKLNNLKEAEAEYKKAISINPDYAPAHSSLSAVYLKYGKFDQAAESAKKAIRLDPNFSWAHNNLAIAYMDTGRLDEAIEEFTNAISISPDVPDFHSNLAIIYVNKNDLKKAVDEINKTIEIDPKFEGAYFNLANVYYKMNNYELYEKELKLAIEYNKHYSQAYLALFEYYAYANRPKDLLTLYNQYINITGKSEEQVKNEINNSDWMLNRDKILEIITDNKNTDDADRDGLTDEIEDAISTNPYSKDTDGDGYDDFNELKNGYNPMLSSPGDKYGSPEYEEIKAKIKNIDEASYNLIFENK